MVVVETPYYQIGWGGMMVEDMIVVRPGGNECLTDCRANCGNYEQAAALARHFAYCAASSRSNAGSDRSIPLIPPRSTHGGHVMNNQIKAAIILGAAIIIAISIGVHLSP